MVDASDDQHFQGEDGAGQWRAEYRAESRRDASEEEDSVVRGGGVKESSPTAGKASAHLNCRALTPRGAAEEVGDEGSQEYQRRHPSWHASAWSVDLVEDEIVPASGVAANPVVDQSHQQSAQGEKVEQPAMVPAVFGDPIQQPEKSSGGRSREDAHGRHPNRPPGQLAQGEQDFTSRGRELHAGQSHEPRRVVAEFRESV